MEKIDLKDQKLLYELDINARESASAIGKKIGLSKQVVTYRIGKLIESGIIQKFLAIYDTSKLGFATYKIFLRLQNVDIAKQNKIIDYLKNHEQVQFFASTDGMFDFAFNVLAENAEQLYTTIKELENKYGHYIAEKEIVLMVFSSFFFRNYLLDKKTDSERKPMFFGSQPTKTKIDNNDKKILSLLATNARIPVIDIASKISLNPDSIRNKIKRLGQSQIIQNYVLLPNFEKLNQTSYKIMFALHNVTQEIEEKFLEFARTQPNIWFHSKTLGKWDMEINMDVDNANQFREIMMEIKSEFSGIIKEYNTLQISHVHKFNFYPFKID